MCSAVCVPAYPPPPAAHSLSSFYARRTPTRVNTGESGKGFNDIFTEHSVEAKRLSIITNALTSANTDADKTINAEEFIKAMVMLQNGLEKLGWPTGKHCTQCTLW